MKRRAWADSIAVIAILAMSGAVARAEVKLNGLFTDNMVLQHGREVPVWGTASDGEKVAVRLAGQEVSTTAKDGTWMVRLQPIAPGASGTMIVEGTNRIELGNVLVGDVWICSGQSNMQWPLRLTLYPDRVIPKSANAMIRLFTVKRKISDEPLDDLDDGPWVECGPETVPNFSAVAYFFGAALQEARKVPVGLIHTSWGGTPAESWTSRGALEADPMLAPLLDKPKPDKPNNPHWPARLFNAMIHPLLPYAISGAIWYQGESNAGRAYEYRALFPTMIRDWRRAWGQGDFPFLFVQLAPFRPIVNEPVESAWAELREAQLLTTKKLPKTAMAVIIDVGNEKDIHPRAKQPVGQRLALGARALACGEDIPYSGPVYRAMKVEGNKIVLSFDHVDAGLVGKGGTLTGFTIAGADHKFVNAFARIRGDRVEVWAEEVADPVAVRYGWADYPVVNLWNEANLPASPFRTDDWPMITEPKDK